MSGEKSAAPKVAVTVEGVATSTTSDPLALAKTVQGSVTKAPVSRWKWSKKKKEALRLILQGQALTEVASKVGAHRNTLTGWMKHHEWLAETRRYIEESQVSTKFRRLKTTTIIADQLAAKSVSALTDKDMNLGQAGLVLREHLNYVKAERDLFGEGASHDAHGPGTVLNITVGGAPGQTPAVDPAQQATSRLAFLDFMAKYDPNLAVVARTPQEAAVILAEKVLQESSLLDTIREEDRVTMVAETVAAEQAKRKR